MMFSFHHSVRWLAGGVLAVGVVLGVMATTKSEPLPMVAIAPVAAIAPAPAGRSLAVGYAGCSAAHCHGDPSGVVEGMVWKSSASTWLSRDPHADAYRVLTTPAAEQMMKLYNRGRANPKPAYEEARCLACHSNPQIATDGASAGEKPLRAEGVSCEACHGNGGNYRLPHTAKLTVDENAKLGMKPLSDDAARAAVCLGCHVGAPASGDLPLRDMNHDMIAAGHPRLDFEYASGLARMPKHWCRPDNWTDAWLVGHDFEAAAIRNLAAERAARAEPRPEFAEQNCTSCHHALAQPPRWTANVARMGPRLPWPIIERADVKQDGSSRERAKAILLSAKPQSLSREDARRVFFGLAVLNVPESSPAMTALLKEAERDFDPALTETPFDPTRLHAALYLLLKEGR